MPDSAVVRKIKDFSGLRMREDLKYSSVALEFGFWFEHHY
jgi:hypothetical protein